MSSRTGPEERQGVLAAIGGTPLVLLRRLQRPGSSEVWAKLECLNPSGSIKDRAALAMVEAAEDQGRLEPGGTIVEATSGNTGVALALVAAAKGYRLIVTMPEDSSPARMGLLQRYGVEVLTTPAAEGMEGSLARARELADRHPDYFMPDQFSNPAVVEVHRRTTAREILEQTGGSLRALVAGVGTGGTITGVGGVLRREAPEALVVAVEPAASPLLSAGWSGPHHISGLGASFLPPNLDRHVIDRVVTVSDTEAFRGMALLAREEGLLVGPSSGACVQAALRLAEELGPGHRVVTILADRGDRHVDLPG